MVPPAVDYLAAESGAPAAASLIDAAQGALNHIARHPHHGSLRFAYEMEVPNLRVWPVPRFSYLVFYVERDAQIDVWRILHTRRDLPAALVSPEDEDW